MWKWIKEKFFFLIDRDEKEYIRQNVMKRDHTTLSVIMCVLMLIEAIMFALSLFGVDESSNHVIEVWYKILYIFLFSVCLISLITTNYFFKKEKPFPYFLCITLFAFSTMLWGVGISILASYSSFTILYYALALLACSALICLEPWINLLTVLLSSIAYIVLYYTLDGLYKTSNSIFIGGIFLLAAISIVAFFFNFYRRINALKLEIKISKLNKTLEDKTYLDDLTKIYNRRYLTKNINRPLNYENKRSGIMMIDLDHFKLLNDTYGHQVGDNCLEALGSVLNEFIISKDGYCVRFGGEEFLIYLDQTDEEELTSLAENLRKKIEKTKINLGGTDIKYTISIGLAIAHDNISYNELIHEADEALYKAKEKRNIVYMN